MGAGLNAHTRIEIKLLCRATAATRLYQAGDDEQPVNGRFSFPEPIGTTQDPNACNCFVWDEVAYLTSIANTSIQFEDCCEPQLLGFKMSRIYPIRVLPPLGKNKRMYCIAATRLYQAGDDEQPVNGRFSFPEPIGTTQDPNACNCFVWDGVAYAILNAVDVGVRTMYQPREKLHFCKSLQKGSANKQI